MKNKRIQALAFHLIMLFGAVCLFASADHFYGFTSKPTGKSAVQADGAAYYAYLPQYFVYPDQEKFGFLDSVMHKYPTMKYNDGFGSYNDKNIRFNKYYVGTSLVQMPFYLIAHGVLLYQVGDASGYGNYYEMWILIAALFYWYLAMINLRAFFQRLDISNFAITASLGIVTFGTILWFYTAYYYTFSHVYSFALVAIMLNLGHLWSLQRNKWILTLLLFVLGLIVIARPINILLAGMILFFFANTRELWNRLIFMLKKEKVQLVIGLLSMAGLVGIQLYTQYEQTGTFALFTYGDEAFDNALQPKIGAVLFDWGFGFFPYNWPVLLAIPGLYILWRMNIKNLFFGVFLVALGFIYVVSAWWDWHYGGSFSLRPLIELLPIFMIPVAFFLHRIPKWSWILILPFFGCSIYTNYTRQIQYLQAIIEPAKMNFNSYLFTLWKTEDRFRWQFSLPSDTLSNSKDFYSLNLNYHQPHVSKSTDLNMVYRGEDVIVVSPLDTSKHIEELMFRLKLRVNLMDKNNVPFLLIKRWSNGESLDDRIISVGALPKKWNQWEWVRLDANYKPSAVVDSIHLLIHKGEGQMQWNKANLSLLD